MKANRSSILRDEDAVSPVIAVILMVAITVVLAATVFVLVSDIGKNAGQAPMNMGITNSETDDNLVVTSAGTGDWDAIELRADQPVRFNLTGASGLTTAGTFLAQNTWVAANSGAGGKTGLASVSDTVDLCGTDTAGTAGAALTNVRISMQDAEAKSLIGNWDFSTIVACA